MNCRYYNLYFPKIKHTIEGKENAMKGLILGRIPLADAFFSFGIIM